MEYLTQQVRNSFSKTQTSNLLMEIDHIKEISKRTKITVNQVIEIQKNLEMERRNDLYHANGDIFDEQMQGIGELLQRLIISIEKKQ